MLVMSERNRAAPPVPILLDRVLATGPAPGHVASASNRHELIQRSDRDTAQTAHPHRAQRTRPHQLMHFGPANSKHTGSVLGTHEQDR